jgi:myo-inositol-1-phosphate synthase
LWLVGALGGVASTVALGLAAMRRRLIDSTGLVTSLPDFQPLDLDAAEQFVLGGHDIRTGDWDTSVRALAKSASVFDSEIVAECRTELKAWSAHIRPGILLNCGPTIAALADRNDIPRPSSPRKAIEHIQRDLQEFRESQRLDQVAVVNVASSEPLFSPGPAHENLNELTSRLDQTDILPVSSLYAYSAIDLGWPYINFTPSRGANLPALIELAQRRGAVIAGQDGKTGETLLKSVLAPMFAARNLRVLSWVGHNILGNRDGRVLNDPDNRASKVAAKDRVVADLLGYSPQTHTSIEYIESLDDWKTAWDHVHFQGFLGVKMSMQLTWQGCDSVLAAPLVIDLARLALYAQRQREVGVLRHLACFFKSPMGTEEHCFERQAQLLTEYVRAQPNPVQPRHDHETGIQF